MMTSFRIENLAHRPDCIQACAAWAYGRWGVQRAHSSLEQSIAEFTKSAQEGQLPLTMIAVNTATDRPVAMGSLQETDGTTWPNQTPWIASIYTLYRYRGLGLASKLIKSLEATAQSMGFKEVYLQSGSAADFYLRLGYREIRRINTNETASGTASLLFKSFK